MCQMRNHTSENKPFFLAIPKCDWMSIDIDLPLLAHNLHVARQESLLGLREPKWVSVNTTVQERTVAFSTDARGAGARTAQSYCGSWLPETRG